jgi:hypothetical protein
LDCQTRRDNDKSTISCSFEPSKQFKIDSMQWVDGAIVNTGVMDWMPDIGRAAGLVRHGPMRVTGETVVVT